MKVVGDTGDRPVETAKNAITRVGTNSKCGFGELRVTTVESRSDEDRFGEVRKDPTTAEVECTTGHAKPVSDVSGRHGPPLDRCVDV